jgi:hypothetical protein
VIKHKEMNTISLGELKDKSLGKSGISKLV